MGVSGPFKRLPDDYMGLAVAWGRPVSALARDTVVGEYFYRFQAESASQLTLSLQLIRSSTVYDTVFVFGARYRIEF